MQAKITRLAGADFLPRETTSSIPGTFSVSLTIDKDGAKYAAAALHRFAWDSTHRVDLRRLPKVEWPRCSV